MTAAFHPLTVQKTRLETPDCISIWLAVPEHLQKEYAYRQGQYLTLRIRIDGQEVRRTYSLCSSPLSGQWRIAVKQVQGGLFSDYAFTRLKAGDVLEALPPGGRFYTELDASNRKHYMAFAAGSGITPVYSIIETTLQAEPDSHFTLIYGNRSSNRIIFKEELEALKNRYLSRFTLQYILSQEPTDIPLQQGRIDTDKCRLIFNHLLRIAGVDTFFLCGPREMIFTVKDFLEAAGVPTSKIHFELFSGASVSRPALPSGPVTAGTGSRVTIKHNGLSSSFLLPFDGTTILDAALQQGADLPYACKGGVCCTCKARLTTGQVQMEVNYGLEPDEIAAGFVLTCQSRPASSDVVIDFDAV